MGIEKYIQLRTRTLCGFELLLDNVTMASLRSAPADKLKLAVRAPDLVQTIHLVLDLLSTGVTVREIDFKPFPVQLNATGNIQAILEFLHVLEYGERFIRIDQIEFRRDLAKNDTLDVDLNIMGYELRVK